MVEIKRRRGRGLPSIAKAKEDRASGRGRWTTQAGLMTLVAVVGGFVAHGIVTAHELKKDRAALMAKQRAIAVTLGQRWFPLRDRLEGEILASAKDYAGDAIEPAARRSAFRTQPGVYLRMRVADAKDAASIRRVAAETPRDAFAACLLREPNERAARGDADAAAFAEQPWNLGQAYAATRILTDDWALEVETADDDLRLRVFEEQYDKAVRSEIPLAIDVVERAQFLLLALDEDVPEAAKLVEGGPITEAALQLVPHPTRVHVFDVASGRELVRLRRTGEAQVIPVGERVISDPEIVDAMQRQANNCALAGQVDLALATPPAPAPGAAGK